MWWGPCATTLIWKAGSSLPSLLWKWYWSNLLHCRQTRASEKLSPTTVAEARCQDVSSKVVTQEILVPSAWFISGEGLSLKTLSYVRLCSIAKWQDCFTTSGTLFCLQACISQKCACVGKGGGRTWWWETTVTLCTLSVQADFILGKSEVTSEHRESPERKLSAINTLIRRKNWGIRNVSNAPNQPV